MDELRKIERKKKRFAVRLKNSKKIICTDIPGLNIVLCNVGQATGFKKNDLLLMLEKITPTPIVLKFIAEKGDSHCFIVFSRIEEAKIFYDTYDGTLSGNSDVPLYMCFVESVPNNEIICSSSNPEGLTLIEGFITEDEEKQLYQLFDWIDESNLKNRQVKHYGYEFRYGSNDVDLNQPLDEKIPQECEIIWKRLEDYGINFSIPDQLTVNKYSPGQGIPSHVDKHSPFGDTILSLSLNSSVVMDWKHHSKAYVPVVVPSRSLLVMQAEARYDWQHGIQPRTWDPIIEVRKIDNGLVKVITSETKARGTRISLTFRKTRQGPCNCCYETLCDSRVTADLDEVASHLEDLHVHQVYEQIAGHFSSTRHKPWPKVVEFLQDIPPGSIVLDLGAGNGKNILNRNDLLQVACEYSAGLLSECRSVTRACCVRADVLHAPLCDCRADAVLCVAVIHHFSTYARRRQAIASIARLLRPGGRALVTVWAKDQSKSNYLCKDKVNTESDTYKTAGIHLPVHQNRTQFKHNDVLVPWKLRKVKENKLENESSQTLLRYYHVFEEHELEELCRNQGVVVEKSFYEEGNWCVICQKI
ncbi:hypothetical protein KGM_211918 [Danaus plexippus plexippus]|uniref:Uncharacterized protein n=1 Tax=Danaus plexippus plexippus TaxID=278856 RepID=A0A212ETM0_DANPL|nr:hypothetical protein KGM_211918 [Danaus plexippus plexippus]